MVSEKLKFGYALYKATREIYNYVNGTKWPSNVRMLKLIQLFKLDINSILN